MRSKSGAALLSDPSARSLHQGESGTKCTSVQKPARPPTHLSAPPPPALAAAATPWPRAAAEHRSWRSMPALS